MSNKQLKFKIGDLVESCSMLPGFIESIESDGDNFTMYDPSTGNMSCHSVKNCGCKIITHEYAMMLWKLGDKKLRKLWEKHYCKDKPDEISWNDAVTEEYKRTIHVTR